MTSRQALTQAYTILSPYADKQRWEFDNNLVHLRFITRYISQQSIVLDVGCGVGILAVALTCLGYSVSGVDKYLFEDDNSFSVADRAGLERIWQAQGIRITSTDVVRDRIEERYDAVISIATVEHQKDPRIFLEHLQNVLRPQGVMYVATPNISHLLNRVRFVCGRSPMSGHLHRWFVRGEAFEGHWREYTLTELTQMMSWLGLTVVAARNVQSMRPRFDLKHMSRELCRVAAYGLPGTRDTNIVISKKIA